jgi:hypothetical protein
LGVLLNVPAGAALVTAALAWVPADEPRATGSRSDPGRAVTLTAGLIALAFGVHESVSAGWGAPGTLVPILGGLALLRAFAVIEARVAVPLMPMSKLRTRSLLFANIAGALLWASLRADRGSRRRE